jgi:hypothetical protein
MWRSRCHRRNLGPETRRRDRNIERRYHNDFAGSFANLYKWILISGLALGDNELPDEYFDTYLKIIESGIHKQKNRVRYEMNGALITIGLRNEKLEKKAMEVARKIGKVIVDHGDTDCKTPDAVEYIARTKAYRNNKKAKAAAK